MKVTFSVKSENLSLPPPHTHSALTDRDRCKEILSHLKIGTISQYFLKKTSTTDPLHYAYCSQMTVRGQRYASPCVTPGVTAWGHSISISIGISISISSYVHLLIFSTLASVSIMSHQFSSFIIHNSSFIVH